MIHKKYFGIIDAKQLDSLNFNQIDTYLFDKKLAYKSYRQTNTKPTHTSELGVVKNRLEISDKNMSYLYIDEVTEVVHDFLLEHYKAGIGGEKALFQRDFDDETFGLPELEKKKVALDYFNKYFNLVKGDFPIGMEYNSKREIVAEKRFKTLYALRESFRYQLQEPNNLVLSYLLGSLDYFSRETFESLPFLIKMFNFENILSILIDLNKKFNFEQENFFTPKTKAQNIYEEYHEQFYSLKQLDFIEQELNIEYNKKPKYITSLYFFFKNEKKLKIPKEPTFREIINHYFNTKFNRIKVSDSSSNSHQKRLKQLSKEWDDFQNK